MMKNIATWAGVVGLVLSVLALDLSLRDQSQTRKEIQRQAIEKYRGGKKS